MDVPLFTVVHPSTEFFPLITSITGIVVMNIRVWGEQIIIISRVCYMAGPQGQDGLTNLPVTLKIIP